MGRAGAVGVSMCSAFLVLLAIGGCAEIVPQNLPGSGDPSIIAPPVFSAEPLGTLPGLSFQQAAATEPDKPAKKAASTEAPEPLARPPLGEPPEGESYDPFQREDETAQDAEEYDPLEFINVRIFTFNYNLDKYVLKPVAKVYDRLLPDELELGIRNFFHNIRFVPRALNSLLQGKARRAGLEVGRFLINTTFGLAGFLDFAREVFDMEKPPLEDAGQTLAVYGVPPGPYLMVPVLGPFTLRDLFGYNADFFLDPFNYLILPSIEVEGAPEPFIDHTQRMTTTMAQLGTRTFAIVNERSINLETFQGVEEGTVDLYGAVRNFYLQQRRKQVRE